MHLDCARQFYTIEEIKRLFDYMCFFKLNRFHWHLTDNEAWRVELRMLS
jgi:hexosaminidase